MTFSCIKVSMICNKWYKSFKNEVLQRTEDEDKRNFSLRWRRFGLDVIDLMELDPRWRLLEYVSNF